jgi:hypothetical protein
VVTYPPLPSGSIQPQAGASWATAVTISNATPTSFQVTFGTAPPPNGGLLTWSVTVVPTGGQYTSLGNLVRGLGGTAPAAHPAGATVTYLIFRFRGYRIPTLYNVGQSNVLMDLPPAWDEPLHKYMLARFREYEQDDEGAMKLDGMFKQDCADFDGMQADPTGPRQLGWVAPFLGDASNVESLVGTVLIP